MMIKEGNGQKIIRLTMLRQYQKMRASGTPPTRVLTVNNPQLAASNMAMQNASVKELPT